MIVPKEYTYESFPASPELPDGAETIQTGRDDCAVAYRPDIVYDEEHGLTLQLLIPFYADGHPALFPCIVFIQGSAWGKQNVYVNVASLSKLANRGYTVAIVEYRPSSEAPFPAQIIDAKAAIRFLRKNASSFSIDPDRIIVSGDSSGGHTALMVTVTAGHPYFSSSLYDEWSDRVGACIDFYGPTAIWEMNDAPSSMDHCGPDSPEGMLLGGVPVLKNLDKARETDPVAYLSADRPLPPIFILHGDKDPLVPFRQSVRLYEALRANQKECFFLKLLGAEHGGPSFWTDEILDRIDRFLNMFMNHLS